MLDRHDPAFKSLCDKDRAGTPRGCELSLIKSTLDGLDLRRMGRLREQTYALLKNQAGHAMAGCNGSTRANLAQRPSLLETSPLSSVWKALYQAACVPRFAHGGLGARFVDSRLTPLIDRVLYVVRLDPLRCVRPMITHFFGNGGWVTPYAVAYRTM